MGRRLRRARSDTETTLEGFDFSTNTKLPAAQIRDLAALRWLQAGKSIILYGAVGVGKTHVAQAMGHLAIRVGAERPRHDQPGRSPRHPRPSRNATHSTPHCSPPAPKPASGTTTAGPRHGPTTSTAGNPKPASPPPRSLANSPSRPLSIRSTSHGLMLADGGEASHPVGVVEEEEPLQHGPRRRRRETPVRRSLLIAEELHRHEAST
jgi:hypothetical protein